MLRDKKKQIDPALYHPDRVDVPPEPEPEPKFVVPEGYREANWEGENDYNDFAFDVHLDLAEIDTTNFWFYEVKWNKTELNRRQYGSLWETIEKGWYATEKTAIERCTDIVSFLRAHRETLLNSATRVALKESKTFKHNPNHTSSPGPR